MAAALDVQCNAASAMVRLSVSVLGAVLWPNGVLRYPVKCSFRRLSGVVLSTCTLWQLADGHATRTRAQTRSSDRGGNL